MRRKIFAIIFWFLLIKPFSLFSEKVIPPNSSGTEMKPDGQKDKNSLEDLDSLRDPFVPQLPLPPMEEIQKPVVQTPVQPLESSPKQETVRLQPLPQKQATVEEPLKTPVIQISGLIWNSDQPQAIINNQIVKVGDQIEEWTIQKIDKDGIEISARGNKILIPTDFSVGSSSPKAAVDSSKRSSRGKI